MMAGAAGSLTPEQDQVPGLIAVVDDDQGTRMAIANFLESLGMAVVTFGSSEDFLASDLIGDTACLISDVQLPGLSGIALYEALLSRGYSTPVIFVTAYPDGRVREQAGRLGAHDFFSKPFEGAALRRSIEGVLSRSSEA